MQAMTSSTSKPQTHRSTAPRARRHGGGGSTRIEKAKDVRGAFFRLLGYMRPYRVALVVVLLLVVLSSALGVAGPYLLGLAVDQLRIRKACCVSAP